MPDAIRWAAVVRSASGKGPRTRTRGHRTHTCSRGSIRPDAATRWALRRVGCCTAHRPRRPNACANALERRRKERSIRGRRPAVYGLQHRRAGASDPPGSPVHRSVGLRLPLSPLPSGADRFGSPRRRASRESIFNTPRENASRFEEGSSFWEEAKPRRLRTFPTFHPTVRMDPGSTVVEPVEPISVLPELCHSHDFCVSTGRFVP